MKHLKLYDPDMRPVAILNNATNKGYTKKLNDLWQATFSIPANDPKTKLCTPFRIVKMFDGEERVDLFRILPSVHSSDESSEMITFDCEHVLATLTDDLIFQYRERNNLPTADVLSYILSFQATQKWQLGRVDFIYQFSYKWESENLLSSLFSVPEPFVDEYQWTWDTKTMPWTLNLIAPDSMIKTWIRYGRNLNNVGKRTDPTNVCTRLYGLGYGEGVNQLTISEVNGELPYIDADTVGTYGIIAKIYTDTKEENAATLKGKMEACLERLKIPQIEYSVKAAHLYQITKKSIDDFYLGAYCRTIDKEDNLRFTSRVVTISKPDIDGAPGDVELEIANSPQDITKSMSNLSNRQRISEVYAQGATNIDSNDYQDNCDNTHPAVIKFYLPEETVRINKCLLSYETDYFRAYERAIKGGGATTQTTNSDGSHRHKMFELIASDYGPPEGAWQLFYANNTSSGETDCAVVLAAEDFDLYTRTANGIHSHEVSIPSHSHDMDYGIYEFDYKPSQLTIKVDGNVVSVAAPLIDSDLDIIPYLSKDGTGKINRGMFHTVEITPNTTEDNPYGLARVMASVVKQVFIQSRGGGDY